MFKLNQEQRSTFETLLDIINNERKSLVFLNLTDNNFTTISDLRDSSRYEYSGLSQPFKKNVIYSYIKEVFADTNRELLEKTLVQGRKKNSYAKAWRLTKKGKELQPIVAFGLQFLPSQYSLSAYAVIGAMNTWVKKRASYARVSALRFLADEPELSVKQLSILTGTHIKKMQNKLDDLASIVNSNEDELPFIEPVTGDKSIQHQIYAWTGKKLNAADFTSENSKKIIDLVNLFSAAGKETYLSSSNLYPGTTYSHNSTLSRALKTLIKKGYITSTSATQFRKYRLTEIGRDYVQNCIEPMIVAILGEPSCVEYIMQNQPSSTQIVDSINLLIN
jgi:DNA-binding HxlR family transcriptional regulator